jgi:hypothetical protein
MADDLYKQHYDVVNVLTELQTDALVLRQQIDSLTTQIQTQEVDRLRLSHMLSKNQTEQQKLQDKVRELKKRINDRVNNPPPRESKPTPYKGEPEGAHEARGAPVPFSLLTRFEKEVYTAVPDSSKGVHINFLDRNFPNRKRGALRRALNSLVIKNWLKRLTANTYQRKVR